MGRRCIVLVRSVIGRLYRFLSDGMLMASLGESEGQS
jgi:hypothetical protein